MTKLSIEIEALDPLIFGNGKPFEGRLEGNHFVPPQTLSGTLRTIVGRLAGGDFSQGTIDKLKRLAIKGPFLAIASDTGQQMVLPRPLDALCLEDANAANPEEKLFRVAPGKPPAGIVFDSDFKSGLMPLLPPCDGKPKSQPEFWPLSMVIDWRLGRIADGQLSEAVWKKYAGDLPLTLGTELRSHVAIDPETNTGVDSHLFTTVGLRLNAGKQRQVIVAQLLDEHRSFEGQLKAQQLCHPIGGESRLSRFHFKREDEIPACPEFDQSAFSNDHVALQLLTPGKFRAGSLPEWLELDSLAGTFEDWDLQLKSIATSRKQAISGWDYQKKCAKRTRHLVPAGTVYYFKVTKGDARKLAERLWFESICYEQNARDGFGLVMTGPWNTQEKES